MSTAKLKNDLHKYIVETDDLIILKEMKAFFQELTNKGLTDSELNPLEEKMLNIGIEQANEGLLTSNKIVQANVDKWIKEKQK